MKVLISLYLISFSLSALAQIADGSFFPSVRSINPGIAHQRAQALAAFDISQKKVEKNHEVTTGGIVGGIQTDVDLQKNTLFYASKGKFVTFEVLADQETGKKVEHINSTTYGERNVENTASSSYFGGIVDFKLVGLSYSAAKYNIDYEFRAGTPPDVSAKDIKTNIDYNLIKIGSAFNFKGFTFGVFGMEKKSDEEYAYTYYDPTTGLEGTTEIWPATSSATGYGVGLGYTSKTFRMEVSTEQMSKSKVKYDDNPMEIIKQAPASSRTSVAVEARLGKLSLGARIRNNVGNYTDLEDLISSNLLYGEMSASDSRMETSFNFGFGSDKGFTFSAFYTQSESKADEESTIFANGTKYPSKTKSTAFGGNVSYYF